MPSLKILVLGNPNPTIYLTIHLDHDTAEGTYDLFIQVWLNCYF